MGRVAQWPVVGHMLLNVSPGDLKRSREVAGKGEGCIKKIQC